MKKKLLLLLCVSVLCGLCSCRKEKQDTVPENGMPINCEFGYYNFIVSGDGGYYLLCGSLIAYWDGELEHEAVPLCNQPDCTHSSEECPSFIDTSFYRKLFYADGNLYVFGKPQLDSVTQASKYPFWKIAADGSSKEIVLYTKEWPHMYTVFQDTLYYRLPSGNPIIRFTAQNQRLLSELALQVPISSIMSIKRRMKMGNLLAVFGVSLYQAKKRYWFGKVNFKMAVYICCRVFMISYIFTNMA